MVPKIFFGNFLFMYKNLDGKYLFRRKIIQNIYQIKFNEGIRMRAEPRFPM